MKKTLRIAALFIALTLLTGVFSSIALADGETPVVTSATADPQYTAEADVLKDLGLFQGRNSGYELEKAATRAEAATMLVRLLGLEEEVEAGEYEHPFTDVPAWADNVVGYMYEEGLTKGVSATKFAANSPCEAKMYVTFVLRALGYDEADEDFAYNSAVTDAIFLNVIDGGLALGLLEKTFLRGDMVMISFAALTANVKVEEGEDDMTLLDKLVEEGAVDAEKAEANEDALNDYAEYRENWTPEVDDADDVDDEEDDDDADDEGDDE